MNENNSMAYAPKDDVQSDSPQTYSVYTQDPAAQPSSASAGENGSAATPDSHADTSDISAAGSPYITPANTPQDSMETAGAPAQNSQTDTAGSLYANSPETADCAPALNSQADTAGSLYTNSPESADCASALNSQADTAGSLYANSQTAAPGNLMQNQSAMSATAQDNQAASQHDPVSLLKKDAADASVQDRYPQSDTLQQSYPQGNPVYTQNSPMASGNIPGNGMQNSNVPSGIMADNSIPGNGMQDNRAQSGSFMTNSSISGSSMQFDDAADQSAQYNPNAAAYSSIPLLQLNDLCKRYPGMGTYMSVFHMNLVIPRGRIIGLLGPNGCGKTTLIKMINGLLTPTSGNVLINGMAPCPATKKVVSYLPERTYLDNGMKVSQMVSYFADFYEDFSTEKAYAMLGALGISSDARLKALSKGTKEKVQLILVMSRHADLYILDEPIAGVDPAARDYILRTIITNYNPGSTIILSTHLISDIENVLDDVIFMKNGSLMLYTSVDSIRSQMGKSVDSYFREVYAC